MLGAIGSVVGGIFGGPIGSALGGAVGGALEGGGNSQDSAKAEAFESALGSFAMQIANELVQKRYWLAEDANRTINTLLNDMLSTGLLPRQGEFVPGSEPVTGVEATSKHLEDAEQ